MKTIFVVLAFSHLISGATYKETRKVTDSSGKKFTCTYSLFYNSKTVTKSKSSVSCTPNTKGKSISQDFVIESLGKTVTVKHSIKKGKDAISAVTLKDYVPPTTSVPTPSPSSGEAMDCTCKLPGMAATEMGRSVVPFALKGQAGSDRKIMKPIALTRGRGGGYHGGYYGGGVSTGRPSILSSLIPLALGAILAGVIAFGGTALLSALFTTTVNIIGRKLPVNELAETEDSQARLLAKLNDRQLFGNLFGNIPAPAPAPASPLLGLLGGSSGGSLDLASLLGAAGGSSGSSDLVNQIAMQVVQQQMEDFVNNGGAEAAMTDLVESGKLEEMINSLMESAMENINTEEMMANIQSNLEESMADGGFEDMMSEVNIEELMGGLKLEELMGGMEMTELMNGMDMTELMNGMDLTNMEMEMQCSCVPTPSG